MGIKSGNVFFFLVMGGMESLMPKNSKNKTTVLSGETRCHGCKENALLKVLMFSTVHVWNRNELHL